MPTPLPLYLQVKPPKHLVPIIARFCPEHGICSNYGVNRYHSPVQPIGDARAFSDSRIETIQAAIADLLLEPFDLRFDRIELTTLRGSGMSAFRARQVAIVQCLTRLGIPVPAYILRPHLSLAYGDKTKRNIRIPQIGWTATELLLVMSVHGEGRHELITS